MQKSSMFIPEWLRPLMGQREWAIANCSEAWTSVWVDPHRDITLVNNCDLERLAPHQQHIIAGNGNYFTIDSKRRMIIG